MSFLSPWWLLLLIPVAGLVLAYLLQQRRRQQYAVRFATLPMLERLAPKRPGWRRHLPAALLAFALVLLALAAARPEASVRVPKEEATVVVVMDTSRSMEATDVEPSRLEAARSAAASFVEGLPDDFNVGVVTFDGGPSVLAAPSTDHRLVIDRLDDLELGPGTAIGEGLATAVEQVQLALADRSEESTPDADGGRRDEPLPGRIVLLSDGTNTVGRDPADAAELAREAGIPVSTIAYGTQEASVDINGQLIPVPSDPEAMQALADATGGTSYSAESGEELEQVYEDIGSSIGWRWEEREITAYAAALALLLALVAGALSLRWFSRLP